MRLSIRCAPISIGTVLLTALVCAVPAVAHEGHDHGAASDPSGVTFADRASALTTAARVESARRRAPDAVHGQCTRTIEVPLQGASCDLGDGMWGVLQPDGTTAQTHGPDIYAASTPQIDLSAADTTSLTAAADLATYPDDADFVTCAPATSRRVPRTVVVFAKPPGVVYGPGQVDDIVTQIRIELRKASAFVTSQADVDRGGAGASQAVTFRMQCIGNTIDVQVRDIGDPARDEFGDPTFAGIEAAIRATGVVGADDAARIVAYAPFDMGSVAGQGWVYDDPTPTRDNLNNAEDQFAVHYLTEPDPTLPDGIEWDVFLHEMLHNMGAVSNDTVVPDANGMGHCTSDKDVMCYDEPGHPTAPRCAKTQLDCGRDTYFNATNTPTGWIASHWNAGATTNRYLDFATRTQSDIVAPTRPTGLTVSSPAPNTAQISWDPSTDDQGGAVRYDLLHGASSPTQVVPKTDRVSGRLTNLPSGTRRFWIVAYDAHLNASVMSAPVTVQIEAPPVQAAPTVDPPAPEPERTAPTAIVAPTAPIATRITSIRPGAAVIAWAPGAGTSADTTFRVELFDADASAWQFATIASAATSAVVRIRPGTTALARVVADNEAGTARGEQVRFATSVRGASCRWVAADRTAPSPPKGLRPGARTTRTVAASFVPAADANGVCAVRLLVRVGSGPWRPLPGAISGAARTSTFTGLKRRSAVQLALEAVDARGNVSRRAILRTRTR